VPLSSTGLSRVAHRTTLVGSPAEQARNRLTVPPDGACFAGAERTLGTPLGLPSHGMIRLVFARPDDLARPASSTHMRIPNVLRARPPARHLRRPR